MNEENRTNLLKLADYLTTVDPAAFGIRDYRRTSDGGVARFKSTHDCGTVGCALGWAPFVIPTETSDFRASGALDWGVYCERVFGLNDFSDEWNWCFASSWANIDNTPIGASLRIRELVINGLPADARAQRIGNATYMFEKETSVSKIPRFSAFLSCFASFSRFIKKLLTKLFDRILP